jgi:hypothetical protein
MLKSKDQAVDFFIKYKAEMENSTGNTIKVLRSDRGGEFLAGAFQSVCEQAGIRHHFTAPYTPQQNGVVERKNRTVMEMARALLKSMNIPGVFWAEAVRHAVYLLNRLPTKPMGDRTPYEAINGRKPHLGHLRMFGCTGHVRPAVPHLKKLDDRSLPMVYLGIEEGSKAHRMFNPNNNRIVVSRDVVFEESRKWSWDAAEKTDFVEVSDGVDGQFIPVTVMGNDGDSGANDLVNEDSNDSGGALGGENDSAAVAGSESAIGGIQSQTVGNPTTGDQAVSPQISVQSSD